MLLIITEKELKLEWVRHAIGDANFVITQSEDGKNILHKCRSYNRELVGEELTPEQFNDILQENRLW